MTARVQIPAKARRGEVLTVRIAIQHPMETGFRFRDNGSVVPKNVVNRLTCRYNGVEVFRAEMGSGVAANPLIEFFTVAEASGEFVFEWVDDEGVAGAERARITVSG